MAVYERNYRPYAGSQTSERTRFLCYPRYAYEDVFRSKLFLAFLVVCLFYPFCIASLLYLPHNLGFLKTFSLDPEWVRSAFNFDAKFFYTWLMLPQGFLAFVLTFIVGPALISADLRNNGLALYFSRPPSRAEYVLGKLTVLICLLSGITWIPGLAVFAFQVYLEGTDWLASNWRAGTGILFGAWIWILVLSLVSLALSAYVKWKPVARLSMILVFVVAAGMSGVINLQFRTDWASVINLSDMVHVVWARLFGVESQIPIPVVVAWLSLLTACTISLGLLARKLRPYEVVR